jgi:hypothetical protein
MTATQRIDLHDLRIAGALMLGAGIVRGALHSSLGLPCPLRAVTGIPCPLCGMTTSVSAAATGRVGTAIAANPAGVIAVVVALVLVVRPRSEAVNLPRWVIPAALVVMWIWQLFRFQLI